MAQAQQFDPGAAYSPVVASFDPKSSYAPAEDQEPESPDLALGKQILSKLREAQNLTQEGKAQHPIQAAIGEFTNRVEQMLVGGKGGGLDMKTGFLNNPVTSTISTAPADEEINLARGVIKKGAGTLKRVFSSPAVTDTASSVADAATNAGRAVAQKASPEMGASSVAMTRGAGTTGGAVTRSITNDEVMQHAHDIGVNLTAAQGLGSEAAKSEQALGEQAAFTGDKIKQAVTQNKAKLADAVDEFQNRLDPQRVGLSSESTGEHLQSSVEIARSALKDNVNYAYEQVRNQQADLAGDVTGRLQKLIQEETFARQPHAAVEQPIFQTSAAKAAINDIKDMLSDPAMQGRQSVQSLRNLRTTLLEKGNDYGANALSDSGQRIYKLAAGKVDDAIMDAAKGTPFEQTFRDAGAQNSKLQQLYNQRGSPLYKILNTDDPAKVADGILNRSSVHEIEALKSEGIDLGPLARQAVEDIKNGGFRVTTSGLGGYPDTFLRSLLGPDATKELYIKADIARRLSENYNPSGSGKVILGAAQAVHPVLGSVFAQGARLRSMPQDPIRFFSQIPKP